MAWSAAQDAAGRMYFGCDTVISYDGDRWQPQKMDATYLVRGLDVGPNGRIWAAGVNQIGWFDAGDRGTLHFHSLIERLPPGAAELGDVWRVYAEGPEAAVFVARGRVLRWDGQRMTSWEFPGVHLLWSTRTAKALYVDYPPQGLMKIGDDGPTLAVPASVLGTAVVGWVDDSGPDWLLMTSQGFSVLHDGVCTAQDSEASAFARANTATCAVRLGDGTLAIGTLKGGIAVAGRSGEILRLFNQRSGLPSNQVYALFVDRDGALWGMGPAHIFRLGIGSGTTLFGQRSGYPPGGSDSLARDSKSLFIATHSDILRLDPDEQAGGAGQFEAIGLTSSRFYSLLPVPGGLAVGHLHGLGLWSHGVMKPVGAIDEAVFRTIPSRASPERILASLSDRVLSVDLATGAAQVVAQGLPDYGDTVVDDFAGRVWVGTPSRGLFVADARDRRAIPAGMRFGSVPQTGPAFVTAAGTTVIALTGTGAFFLDAASTRFQRVDGFPGGNPSAVSNPDSRGGVWAALFPDSGGRSPKIGRISLTPRGAVWMPQSIEGLSSVGSVLGLHLSGFAGREELWMSGTESLLRASPEALAPHPSPRKPVLNAWVVADASPATGVLPYSTRGLHIEYASLDYSLRDSERFETLLGGAESQWSPPSDAAERDISGLREGRYTFRVRLVTDSGEAGEEAVLHFEIAPPWWRTPLARTAFAALGVCCIFGVLRLRTATLKKRAAVLEKMVRQRTQELEKANAAKTEFVTSMSHEIRNPMGGILASALELSATALEPGQQRLVTTLQTCAAFLASLVEDVLDFAAIEAGAYQVSRSGFSPRAVLETVVKMVEPRTAAGSLHVAIDPELPAHIMGDAARIQQVIVNFAVNAVKFGGKTIWLSARSDGEHVVFAVTDDGVGVSPDEQKNLFIRFSRLKPARNAAVPGTGLGLAVCRALAERMGGTVGFADAPGGGSIFFLRLALESGGAADERLTGYEAQGMRALVVEDIDYNARALGLMLGRLGFEVSVAADGEQALSLLEGSRFNAVFLDCDLPRVNGTEVARRFRAAEAAGARAFIVATTALSTAADRAACLASGMDAFVTKPITPQKLRAVLSDLCGNAAQLEGATVREPKTGHAPGINLAMIFHLSDGSPASRERELEKFVTSLDEALRGVTNAHASGPRTAVVSAAHRVLSLARMVGAEGLAATAADIQDYAVAFTDAELGHEVAALGIRADELRAELEALEARSSLNPSRAS
jgi:signal transduction histidine kinase/DNA-binding response OmpR family regulator